MTVWGARCLCPHNAKCLLPHACPSRNACTVATWQGTDGDVGQRNPGRAVDQEAFGGPCRPPAKRYAPSRPLSSGPFTWDTVRMHLYVA